MAMHPEPSDSDKPLPPREGWDRQGNGKYGVVQVPGHAERMKASWEAESHERGLGHARPARTESRRGSLGYICPQIRVVTSYPRDTKT